MTASTRRVGRAPSAGPGESVTDGATLAAGGHIFVRPAIDAAPSSLLKRAQDVCISGLLLIVLSPVLLIVALAIRIDSRGPAFYRCRRVGLGGHEFSMIKFRKMVLGAGGPPLRSPDDERYTRLGRLLAGTRLDEMPQLLNVLRGNMSLVGPRPEDPAFVNREPRMFSDVLRVKPGITGLSQLAFAREDSILDPHDRMGDYIRRILPQKLELDRLYVAQRTIWGDFRILAWTVATVILRRDVAVHRTTGVLRLRRRPALTPAAPHPDAGAPPAMDSTMPFLSAVVPAVNGTATLSTGDGATPAARSHTDGNGDGAPLRTDGPERPNGNGAAPHANGRPSTNGVAALAGTQVVILAGGRGTRLAPYTSILPKPLMPVGERSILETIVDQLGGVGVRRVTLCVGYLSHLIRTVFDNRTSNVVDIVYVHEAEALGTAAPLRMVEGLDDTFIVMNGDVLTTLDYGDLLRHHREKGNLLTIATHDRRIKIDYGMLHLDGAGRVRAYDEKPEIVSPVSMGIYVMEPAALSYLPAEGYFDFPNLVDELLHAHAQVGAFRYDGLWFDIGRQSDYEQAIQAWSDKAAG